MPSVPKEGKSEPFLRPPLQRARSSAPKSKTVSKQRGRSETGEQRLPLLPLLRKSLWSRKLVHPPKESRLHPSQCEGARRAKHRIQEEEEREPFRFDPTGSTPANQKRTKVLWHRMKRRAEQVVNHALDATSSSNLT